MTMRTAGALLALMLLTGCSQTDPVADEPRPTRATDSSTESSEEPTSEESEPAGDGGGGTERTAAVYYVGDTERAGPRLYREFRRGEGEALDLGLELLADQPLDPDYRSLWQGGQLVAASYDGELLTVEVDPSVRNRPAGMTGSEARAAVEQVIYTLQAAVQERAPVQFRTADNPIDQVLGVPTSEPLAQGSALEVLAHASLTTPEQGGTVSGDELRVSGVANSFEANLGWELRRGDRVVRDGFVTAEGWMGEKLFPFEFTVDVSALPAGDYTVWVTTDDPSGGTEGIGAMTDDKDVTIR